MCSDGLAYKKERIDHVKREEGIEVMTECGGERLQREEH
jgi:hypothetical protein